jgi:hypothetical protein
VKHGRLNGIACLVLVFSNCTSRVVALMVDVSSYTNWFALVGSEDLGVLGVLFSVVKNSLSLSVMTGYDRCSVLLLVDSHLLVVDLWLSVSSLVSLTPSFVLRHDY